MAIVVMEKVFDEPAPEEIIDMMRQATEACFEINDVVRKITYASLDRRRFICVCEARDVESVRRSFESAKMQYERLWAATSF